MGFFPDVHGRDLTNYNLGGSAIYALSRDFNLMLEAVSAWTERIAFHGHAVTSSRETNAVISPGFRYAYSYPNDLQIVLGAAVPVGLTSDSIEWGLFFYLSIEQPVLPAQKINC